MAAISGKDGTIKVSGGAAITPIENWTLNSTGNVPNFVDNESGGANDRVMGAGDATGTFEYRLKLGATIPFNFGTTATVEFHIDGTTENYYTVPIIIMSEPHDTKLDGSKELTIVYEWGATGAITPSGILSASGV